MITLIRGLPGSGKSTLAEKLAGLDSKGVHIETDQFFIVDKEYKFDPSKLSENHKLCLEMVYESVHRGYNPFVANTFTQMWEMQNYIDLAKEFEIGLNVITCEGSFGSIHNVPEESIKAMKERWEKYES